MGVLKVHDGTSFVDVIGLSGLTDHGALTGLLDNDHTQYVNAISDTSTINLTLSSQSISAVTIDVGR